MEYRDFARNILSSASPETKLASPDGPLAHESPGPPVRWPTPARPAELQIAAAGEVKIPAIDGMADPAQRPRILHGLGGLQVPGPCRCSFRTRNTGPPPGSRFRTDPSSTPICRIDLQQKEIDLHRHIESDKNSGCETPRTPFPR